MTSPSFPSPKFERPTEWHECPLCKDDWVNLYPCLFFLSGKDGKKHPYREAICANCAKSPLSLAIISQKYPIEGTSFRVSLQPRFYCLEEKDRSPLHFSALVETGEKSVWIKGGTRLDVFQPDKYNKVQHVDNIFRAWAYVAELSKIVITPKNIPLDRILSVPTTHQAPQEPPKFDLGDA